MKPDERQVPDECWMGEDLGAEFEAMLDDPAVAAVVSRNDEDES